MLWSSWGLRLGGWGGSWVGSRWFGWGQGHGLRKQQTAGNPVCLIGRMKIGRHFAMALRYTCSVGGDG